MTKFLDAKFSSRPATQAYRDNFDQVFKHSPGQLLSESCPADSTGNPIDCGGCEDHAGNKPHNFKCSVSGEDVANCSLGCICMCCDERRDSTQHKGK